MIKNTTIKSIKKTLAKSEYANLDIKRVNEGVSSDVFVLEGDSKLICKVLPINIAIEPQIVANNIFIQKRLKVPRIIYYIKNSPLLEGRSLYIETTIEGVSLRSKEIQDLITKEKILYDAGKQLALINSIKVEHVGWLRNSEENTLVASYNDYEGFLLNDIDQKLLSLEEKEYIDGTMYLRLKKFIASSRYLFDQKRTSLLAHGDFGSAHIYHKDGKFTGIIDFTNMRGASKYHDLGHFYMLDRGYFSDLIKGYQNVFELPPDYFDKVFAESIIIGIEQLRWMSENTPEKLKDYPIFKLFEEV